jgi:hypothetical protein
VTPETAIVLKAIVGSLLAILDVYAAANNATNPTGFGANTPIPGTIPVTGIDGTLHIDSSNPTKDVYRLEITTDIATVAKNPILSLKVSTDADLSSQENPPL